MANLSSRWSLQGQQRQGSGLDCHLAVGALQTSNPLSPQRALLRIVRRDQQRAAGVADANALTLHHVHSVAEDG